MQTAVIRDLTMPFLSCNICTGLFALSQTTFVVLNLHHALSLGCVPPIFAQIVSTNGQNSSNSCMVNWTGFCSRKSIS